MFALWWPWIHTERWEPAAVTWIPAPRCVCTHRPGLRRVQRVQPVSACTSSFPYAPAFSSERCTTSRPCTILSSPISSSLPHCNCRAPVSCSMFSWNVCRGASSWRVTLPLSMERSDHAQTQRWPVFRSFEPIALVQPSCCELVTANFCRNGTSTRRGNAKIQQSDILEVPKSTWK